VYLFNQTVPAEVGFVNALLTKKKLREIIGSILKYKYPTYREVPG
jgi:DNA-directed RNA polymerase subunit beta'